MEFCPIDVEYKSKIGGIRANEPLTLSLRGEALEAVLVLRKEGERDVPVDYPMQKTSGGFEVTVTITTRGLYFYYFRIDGKRYAADDMLMLTEGGDDFLQLVYEGDFRPLGYGVIYQIMPDRFAIGGGVRKLKAGATFNGDASSVPAYLPDANGRYNTEFYGGNLVGITEKLDYLKSLGVTYIYLNPVFESPSSHRYDTGDYKKIDPVLGDEADFAALVSKAKQVGIGIILDGVFSHTGSDSRYFNRYGTYDDVGAYQSTESKYFKWYSFERFPDVYKGWWGFDTLPEVNETEPSYMQFMLGEGGVVEKWENSGIAGWRLDVADELPDGFLEALRRKSKLTVIGEVWENAARKYSYGHRRAYFWGGQLDGAINYPVRTAIIDFVRGGDNTLLRRTLREQLNDYPHEALCSTMNVLGTHDTARILTALSRDELPSSKEEKAKFVQSDVMQSERRLEIASLIQYIIPGTPCLFYGDEAGMTGCDDPFCRAFFSFRSPRLYAHYKRLGQLRSEYKDVLCGGTIDLSPSTDVFVLRREGKTRALTLTVNMSGEAIPVQNDVFGFSEAAPHSYSLSLSKIER